MKMRNLFAGALSLGITLLASNAFAAAWVPPAGTTATFSYSNGGDDEGLFGSPTQVTAGGFDFVPNNFRARAFGGVTTSESLTSDRLYVTLTGINGAASLSTVSLSELGDYSIDNGGGVKAYAFLHVRVLDANYGTQREFFDDDTFIAMSGQGAWTLNPVVTLPTPANSIQIVLNNNLHANSATNGTAIIQKKSVGLDVPVPEPMTLTVAVAGISLLVARRRTV